MLVLDFIFEFAGQVAVAVAEAFISSLEIWSGGFDNYFIAGTQENNRVKKRF